MSETQAPYEIQTKTLIVNGYPSADTLHEQMQNGWVLVGMRRAIEFHPYATETDTLLIYAKPIDKTEYDKWKIENELDAGTETIRCVRCNGFGEVPTYNNGVYRNTKCLFCHGTGRMPDEMHDNKTTTQVNAPDCEVCEGRGLVGMGLGVKGMQTCPFCKGTGKANRPQHVNCRHT